MAEFPLRVRISVSNWNEFVSELRRRLGKEKVKVAIDVDDREMEKEVRKGLEKLFKPPIAWKVGWWLDNVAKKMDEIFGRGGRGRGLRKTFEEFLGSRAPVLLSLFAITNILGNLFKVVVDIAERGAKFSGYMRASLKLLDLIFNLALKPIADVVGMILKPILLMLLKYIIIPWSKITSPKNVKWWEEYTKTVEKYMGMGIPYPLAMSIAAIEMSLKKSFEKLNKNTKNSVEEYSNVLSKTNKMYEDVGIKKAVEYDGALMRIVEDWHKGGKKGAHEYSNSLHKAAEMFGIGGIGAAALFGRIMKLFNISVGSSVKRTDIAMNESATRIEGLVKGSSAPVPTITSIFGAIAKIFVNAYNTVSSLLSSIVGVSSYTIKYYSGGGYTVETPYELGGMPWSFHVNPSSGWVAGLQVGGLIRRTGMYLLHAGEYVVPSWSVSRVGTQVINNVYEVNVSVRVDQLRNDTDLRKLAERLAEEMVRQIERRGRM